MLFHRSVSFRWLLVCVMSCWVIVLAIAQDVEADSSHRIARAAKLRAHGAPQIGRLAGLPVSTMQPQGLSAKAGQSIVSWRAKTKHSARVLASGTSQLYAAAVTYPSGGTLARGIATADVNGDGKTDILVINGDQFVTSHVSTFGVLLGKGDGTFQPAVAYQAGGYSELDATSLTVGDVNGDGKVDVVAGLCNCSEGVNAPEIGVSLGNGDGTFQPPVTYHLDPNLMGELPFDFPVALGDFNGDGKLDVVVGGPANVLMFGNGDGTFQAPVPYGR